MRTPRTSSLVKAAMPAFLFALSGCNGCTITVTSNSSTASTNRPTSTGMSTTSRPTSTGMATGTGIPTSTGMPTGTSTSTSAPKMGQ